MREEEKARAAVLSALKWPAAAQPEHISQVYIELDAVVQSAQTGPLHALNLDVGFDVGVVVKGDRLKRIWWWYS